VTDLRIGNPSSPLLAVAAVVLSLAIAGCAGTRNEDATPPVVSIASPRDGRTTHDTTPVFRGRAGTQSEDGEDIVVDVFRGRRADGMLVETLDARREQDGSYSVSSSGLPSGMYTARAKQADAARNVGRSAAVTFSVDPPSPSRSDPVLVGAGDIADCGMTARDEETAQLIDRLPGATVFTLGDNAYPDGTPAQFTQCYDPTWGRFRSRTLPVLGGHDYGFPDAAGHFSYFRSQLARFGPAATDPRRGYYSYDTGSWHVVVLNAACYYEARGCSTAAQEKWLRADLTAHPSLCTLALYHEPRFSSGSVHGDNLAIQSFWQILYDRGVDLVLNGSEHTYERFAPQDGSGAWDLRHGVRQIIAGTGGYSHYSIPSANPNSEVRNDDTFGVIKLTLHPTSYEWEFVPEASRTFSDVGGTACHPKPPPPPPGVAQVRSTSSAAVDEAGSIVIPRPEGTTEGDLMVALVAHQGGETLSVTPPEGWTPIQETDVAEGTNAGLHAWYRVAGGSEPSSYKFVLNGGSEQAIAGGILAVEDAAMGAPVHASAGQSNSASSTAVPAPPIVTSKPDSLLLYAAAANVHATFAPPPGMTEQWDRAAGRQYKIALEVATQDRVSSGASLSPSAFLSTSGTSVAAVIAIAPMKARAPPR